MIAHPIAVIVHGRNCPLFIPSHWKEAGAYTMVAVRALFNACAMTLQAIEPVRQTT